MEVVASLSQGRTADAQCGLFTHKSVPVIFEPPCILWHLHLALFVSCLQIYHTFCCIVKLLVSQKSETTKLIVLRNNISDHIP